MRLATLPERFGSRLIQTVLGVSVGFTLVRSRLKLFLMYTQTPRIEGGYIRSTSHQAASDTSQYSVEGSDLATSSVYSYTERTGSTLTIDLLARATVAGPHGYFVCRRRPWNEFRAAGHG